MNNILDHINKLKADMFREGIKANTIIIDKEVARVNGFQYLINPDLYEVPTMLLGLKVEYTERLSSQLGVNANFAILRVEEQEEKPKTLADYSTNELLYELKRRTER